MIRVLILWSLAAFALASGCSDHAERAAEIRRHVHRTRPPAVTGEKIQIPMRDGVKLTATLNLPSQPGKYATILVRSPYGRPGTLPTLLSGKYALVGEDVRGCGESQGLWEPFLNERKDGFDTIQWIARQPWSNGKVAMIGASYVAYVQWAAAVENPPALKCIISDSSPPDPYQNIPYENGTFLLATNLWYAGIIGKVSRGVPGTRLGADAYFTRPLHDLDVAVKGFHVYAFENWLAMEKPGDWARGSTMQDMGSCKVPALLLTGWEDGDHVGSQLRWAARPGFEEQFLICGPWGHGAPGGSVIGDEGGQFKPRRLDEIEAAFLERYLGDTPPAGKFAPRALVYLKGQKKWLAASEWPPASSTVQKLYLNSGKTLSSSPSEGTAEYDYDPEHINILPRLRGDPMNDMAIFPLHEEDLPFGHLLFHGEVLKAALQVVGASKVNFHFKSTAVDTDFFFQLFDESPDHLYIPIGQAGKFRARYFATENGALMTPGNEYFATVSLWDAECRVGAGHRLTLMVSSDRFPVYALNLNTGEPLATGVKAVAARQSVLSTSTIEIPILKE